VEAQDLWALMHNGKTKATLLANRVVFYGADLSGNHDTVRTRVLGAVSGTQANAMAFDNLLTYGPNYFKHPPAWAGLSLADALVLLVWIVICAFMVFARKPKRQSWLLGRTLYVPNAILLAIGAGSVWACAEPILFSGSHWGVNVFAKIGFYSLSMAVLLHAWARRGDMNRSLFTRLLIAIGIISLIYIINELTLNWAPSDWFSIVILLLILQFEFDELSEYGDRDAQRLLGRTSPNPEASTHE
jgi:hypothetical protein